jgi:hypothetical protein
MHLPVLARKHGDGRSANEARAQFPDLFKDPNDPFPISHGLPLRPLAGEGLRLTGEQFDRYIACIEEFWQELTAALLPIFCPSPHQE